MAVNFKQKCERCKKNYVTVSSWKRPRQIICYECDKKNMEGEITDPEMKKLFDIDEELYKNSTFLRNIKINYLRYHSLTQPQIDAFKKVIADIKKKKSESKPENE